MMRIKNRQNSTIFFWRMPVYLAFLMVLSCETAEPPYYEGPEFINFEEATIKIKEEEGAQIIKVNVGGQRNITPITVTYIAKANDNAVALSSIDDTILEAELVKTITIPGGQGFAEIEIEPVDNIVPDGEKIIDLQITSVSGGNYIIGFPGPDALNASIQVSIIDDDCPLDRNFIAGNIVETADRIEDEGEEDDGQFFNPVSISADPNNSKGIIISDFGSLFGFSGAVLKVRLDPCTREAEVYDGNNVYIHPDNGPVSVSMPNGVGTFDQDTKVVTLELQIDVEAGTYGVWKFVYKK